MERNASPIATEEEAQAIEYVCAGPRIPKRMHTWEAGPLAMISGTVVGLTRLLCRSKQVL